MGGPQAIGGGQLTVGITANGSLDLEIRIPRPPKECRAVAHSVLLEVRVANHSPTAIEHALLNLRFPASHGLTICDRHGGPLDEGGLISATGGDPPLDCWALDNVSIGGRSDRLFHFFVRVNEPGAYPLKLQVESADLRDRPIFDGWLQVGRAEGERSPEEAISALIDQGVAIAGQTADVVSGSELHREAGGFVLSALVTVLELERPDLRKRLDDAPIDHTGPKTGDDYLRALVRSRVGALYEIRNRLG